MRVETLLSPGLLSNGFLLRREAAKAISSAEITARATNGGKYPGAKQLSDFFTDCASKLSTLFETVAPTASSNVATNATTLTITFSEAMDQTVIPAMTAFAITGDTFTSAVWTSATVLTITGTGFAAGESLTYTKPAVSYLRDLAGNAVATYTANLT